MKKDQRILKQGSTSHKPTRIVPTKTFSATKIENNFSQIFYKFIENIIKMQYDSS